DLRLVLLAIGVSRLGRTRSLRLHDVSLPFLCQTLEACWPVNLASAAVQSPCHGPGHAGARRPRMRATAATISNANNTIFATPAAVAALPPKPKPAATSATMKNAAAQYSMTYLHSVGCQPSLQPPCRGRGAPVSSAGRPCPVPARPPATRPAAIQ